MSSFYIDPASGSRTPGETSNPNSFDGTIASRWSPSSTPLDPHEGPLSVSAELTGVDVDLAPNIQAGPLMDGGASNGSLLQERAYEDGHDPEDPYLDDDHPTRDDDDPDDCDTARGLHFVGRPQYYMGKAVPGGAPAVNPPGPISRSRQ